MRNSRAATDSPPMKPIQTPGAPRPMTNAMM